MTQPIPNSVTVNSVPVAPELRAAAETRKKKLATGPREMITMNQCLEEQAADELLADYALSVLAAGEEGKEAVPEEVLWACEKLEAMDRAMNDQRRTRNMFGDAAVMLTNYIRSLHIEVKHG